MRGFRLQAEPTGETLSPGLLRRLVVNQVQHLGLARQLGLPRRNLVDAENEREGVGRLLPAERRGLVLRHRQPHAIQHLVERHVVPVAVERRPDERPGAVGAAHVGRPVAADAALEVEILAALGLFLGVDAVPDRSGFLRGHRQRQRREDENRARHLLAIASSGSANEMYSPEYGPPLTATTMYCFPFAM